MQAIQVSKKDVRPILEASFPDYRGRKFWIVPVERITLHDLNWGGGTRNVYIAVRFDGSHSRLVAVAPWVEMREGMTIDLPLDALLVEHSDFCGHDMGIRIYCHPALMPRLLPAHTG